MQQVVCLTRDLIGPQYVATFQAASGEFHQQVDNDNLFVPGKHYQAETPEIGEWTVYTEDNVAVPDVPPVEPSEDSDEGTVPTDDSQV